MKKIWKKNKGVIITIAGILLLMIITMTYKVDASTSVDDWAIDQAKDQYTVATIASSTCPHCQNLKPVISKIANKEGLKLYWFEDILQDEMDIITGKYTLEGFQGNVPYTFVVKNGKFISGHEGGMDEATLTSFFETAGVLRGISTGDDNTNSGENTGSTTTEVSKNAKDWYEASKKNQGVVGVIAASWCQYCQNLKPVMEELQKEKGFKLYWFEDATEADFSYIGSKYTLTNYEKKIPYIFLTKNGKFVTATTGGMEKDDLSDFLKTNGIIK